MTVHLETNVRTEAEVAKLLHLVQALIEHHVLTAEDIADLTTAEASPDQPLAPSRPTATAGPWYPTSTHD